MPDKEIWVKSGFGFNSRQPFVSLAVADGVFVQMSPEEARKIGQDLFACAEAAETDAFILTWLSDKLGFKDQNGQAMILNEFRKFREGRAGT